MIAVVILTVVSTGDALNNLFPSPFNFRLGCRLKAGETFTTRQCAESAARKWKRSQSTWASSKMLTNILGCCHSFKNISHSKKWFMSADIPSHHFNMTPILCQSLAVGPLVHIFHRRATNWPRWWGGSDGNNGFHLYTEVVSIALTNYLSHNTNVPLHLKIYTCDVYYLFRVSPQLRLQAFTHPRHRKFFLNHNTEHWPGQRDVLRQTNTHWVSETRSHLPSGWVRRTG